MKKEESRIRYSAEDEDIFNSARILLLFKVINERGFENGVNIERIGYYDFFSAQPFLVFDKEDKNIILDLLYYGFESTTIGYISSSQRFTNRREKLKHYLAVLLMRDLITVKNIDGKILYSITEKGNTIVNQFKSLYSKAYLKSANFIITRLSKFSDKKLIDKAKEWLKAEPFIIDLYDFYED